jgi:glycosyltransferase involved in cell wall biosynthesis/aminoglycoside phosphotransferase (APT) family kinase protein
VQSRLDSPQFEGDFVGQILAHYGLELTRPLENLPFGRRSSNVLVYTSAGKKVFKRYRDKWQFERIVYEHSVLKQLQRIDFPAIRLTLTPAGESWVQQGGHTYALFDYIEGTSYSANYIPRTQLVKLHWLLGKALAQFHRQLAGFVGEGAHHLGFATYDSERRRNLEWHLNVLGGLAERSRGVTDPEAYDLLHQIDEKGDRIGEALGQLDAVLAGAELPRLLIHGDYGLHNVLFPGDGTVTLLDFELTRLEWRLIDLVIMISRLTAENSRAFMAGYQSEFTLSEQEWQLLPQVWQYYMMRGAVQYCYNYFELGGVQRLTAAHGRLKQADWAWEHKAELWRMKIAPETDKAPRVMMVARLFYPWIGGAERQAHKLAQAMVEKQTAAEIVTGWWFRGTPQRELLEGIPIYRNQTLWEFFGIKGLRKFGGYLYILSLIWYLWRRRDEYEVIHVHGLNYHTFAAVLAGRWFKRKVICKLANSGEGSDILKMRHNKQLALSRYMLATALQCDRFVALNKTVVQELKAVHVPAQHIVELPNGVETDSITPKATYELHEPARLVFVGRLHPQKGLDTLLRAFKQLCHLYNGELQLQLLGEGPLREELVLLCEQLEISDNVYFVGQTDQVMTYLQQADIFVLPSRAEGISNALLEAMAVGLSAVVSQIPGNVDVIEHEKNGLLFTVDDPHSLAGSLLTVLTQADFRERLGRQARQRVVDHFSLTYVADRYIALYETLLADGKSAVRPATR